MTTPAAGEALICELAAGEQFGGYCSAFPDASHDAGDVLRVAVQVGLVDPYLGLLERALRQRRAVRDEEWIALLKRAAWPRPLPVWAREPPKPVVIGPCPIGQYEERYDLPRWLRDDVPSSRDCSLWRRSAIKCGAITICVAIIGLALPAPDTLDFWLAMAALVVALIAAAL